MIRDMEKVTLYGVMEGNMKVTGKWESNMDLEYIQ